jgi:hypothetical protein
MSFAQSFEDLDFASLFDSDEPFATEAELDRELPAHRAAVRAAASPALSDGGALASTPPPSNDSVLSSSSSSSAPAKRRASHGDEDDDEESNAFVKRAKRAADKAVNIQEHRKKAEEIVEASADLNDLFSKCKAADTMATATHITKLIAKPKYQRKLRMAPGDANPENFAIIRASVLARICSTHHQLEVQCKKSKVTPLEWEVLSRILRVTRPTLVPEPLQSLSHTEQ